MGICSDVRSESGQDIQDGQSVVGVRGRPRGDFRGVKGEEDRNNPRRQSSGLITDSKPVPKPGGCGTRARGNERRGGLASPYSQEENPLEYVSRYLATSGPNWRKGG